MNATLPTTLGGNGSHRWAKALAIAILVAFLVGALVAIIVFAGGGNGTVHTLPGGNAHTGSSHPHVGR